MTLHPAIDAVTERIVRRSAPSRRRYLDLIERERHGGVDRPRLSCGNLAHGFAASGEDKPAIIAARAMNIGLVTAFNDMLSAHQPYGRYPEQMKLLAREVGATAQVASAAAQLRRYLRLEKPHCSTSAIKQPERSQRHRSRP